MPAKKVSPGKPAAPRRPTVPVSRPVKKDFNDIIILSPGAELTAAEAELRLRTVARHLNVAALPPVIRVAEITPTPAATALALYRAFRAVGRGGPALYLCAGNPAAGALSVLTTDWGNTVLAPNDGTLGLLGTLLELRDIPYTLNHLDAESILLAEQHRMQNPEWQPAPDFALRDLLAPAAALLLAGQTVDEDAAPAPRGKHISATGLHLHRTAFAAGLRTLPVRLGQAVPVELLAHETGYLLNITLDPLNFDQLVDDRARFVLNLPASGPLGIFSRKLTLEVHGPDAHTLGHSSAHGAACHSFGCCAWSAGDRRGKGHHLHLSPIVAPAWDERFLSLHLGQHPCAEKLLRCAAVRGLTLIRTR